MKRQRITAPTGMHDILPDMQPYYKKVYKALEDIADFYDFQKIDTPIVEQLELFEKGTGSSTDVVQKQMYSFKTKGGDTLALRPEFTPGICRSYIEHGMFNLPQPVKVWFYGPLFRYERPQAGRYRQFNQCGFEIIGDENPVIDAQVIQIFYNLLKELKFKNLMIEINSIGDNQCRPYYKKSLANYFKYREAQLCSDCRRRLKENPLRILDCKEEKCQRIKSQAPQMIDYLCEGCKSHFKKVLEFLDELELPYHLNPFLVRGLDYYTKTVFEIFEDSKGTEGVNLNSALVGGGRYDALIKVLFGKDTPACGGAAGVERIVESLKEKIKGFSVSNPKFFLAQLGTMAKRKSLRLIEELRVEKIKIAETLGRDSLKTQLRTAGRIGVDYALILGQREALEDTIIIRNMATGKQDTVKLNKAVAEIKKRIK
ncbi:MAG: histidine--tRNA ligase [Candidatus Parcubacteria bacterium]|nr:histidine--tRNA ligase [Candidatus Parcubacteria bacterium]